MFIPIATDSSIRRTPWVNYGLIAANVLVFMVDHALGGPARARTPIGQFIDLGVLNGEDPRLHQFFTHMFLHGGYAHIFGNMLFLWLFGNAVNAKMGHLPYLLFYLAGGVFAATGYAFYNDHLMLGASGAISAVTTAYLAMFPRSRVTILYWWFFIGTFELPSMVLIVFKMILWDNVLAPTWVYGGESNVAYGAHLAGYSFGLVSICLMLGLRLLPRDQFDVIALLRRWFQRQTMRSIMADPNARAQAQYGRVARPVSFDDMQVHMVDAPPDPVSELKTQISQALSRNDRDTAAGLYEKLLEMDPRQVLARTQQLDVANQLCTLHRLPQAAAAYERYLTHYPSSPDVPHIKLLLGIIYARDLHQYEIAEEHLRQAIDLTTDDRRREQARHWLSIAAEGLGRPAPEI